MKLISNVLHDINTSMKPCPEQQQSNSHSQLSSSVIQQLLSVQKALFLWTLFYFSRLLSLTAALLPGYYQLLVWQQPISLRLLVVAIASFPLLLPELELSRLFHLVKSEEIIKLYGMLLVLQLSDKLLVELGKAQIAQLQSAQRLNKDRVWQVLTCILYVVLHTQMIYFGQVIFIVVVSSGNDTIAVVTFVTCLVKLKSCLFKEYKQDSFHALLQNDNRDRFSRVLFSVSALLLLQTSKKFLKNLLFIQVSHMVVDAIKYYSIVRLTGLKFRNRQTSTGSHEQQCFQMRLSLMPYACFILRIAWELWFMLELWMLLAVAAFWLLLQYLLHVIQSKHRIYQNQLTE